MYKRILTMLSTGLICLLSVAIIAAQANCEALLTDALLAVEENCGTTGRNEACYGYDQVEASFLTTIEDSIFAQPTDKAPVAEIETIRTAPLSVDNGTWGVAIMNLQANLPNTLPGQNVTFVLMGDVEVENAVDPETAFDPNDGMEVTIASSAGANIRSGPGFNFNVLGGAGDGETVLADGLSDDGEWLRIAYRERPAWISLSVIEDASAVADLPTLTSDLQTPMQAIYLRTGIGQPECGEAPDDLLLVQGPDNIEIELTVNGANITLGSSGALRVIEIDGEPFLEIIVFDGQFTTGGQTIQAGQRSVVCLGDSESRGLNGEADDLTVTCDASEPESIDTSEFGEEWCVMENIPANILNYQLEVLCPDEIPDTQTVSNTGTGTTTNTNSNNSNNTGTNTNTGTSSETSTDNDTGINTTNDGSSDTSEIGGVDCSTFSLPPQPIIATDFILSWTAATGANEYHVAVFDGSGTEISLITGITETSIGLNGGNGFANTGAVHVRAYRDGVYACYESLAFANRIPDPNEPPGGYPSDDDPMPIEPDEPPPPSFSAELIECQILGGGDAYAVVVSWENAGATVEIMVVGETFIASGPSGSDTFIIFDEPTGVTVSSDGDTLSFVCTELIDPDGQFAD